jgi:5-methylcytosine-specific restriction endonuclease McrA
MARPSGEKIRCGGRWTEARYNQFVRSLLRGGTRRWAPISDALRKAKVGRGIYKCNSCNEDVPVTTKDEDTGKRVKNVLVDHINPIVDPEEGFINWDTLIERMFCEEDNLQVVCHKCHTIKTTEERGQAKDRRAREKNV